MGVVLYTVSVIYVLTDVAVVVDVGVIAKISNRVLLLAKQRHLVVSAAP